MHDSVSFAQRLSRKDFFITTLIFNLSIFIGPYRKQIELRYKNWAFFFISFNSKFVSIL